MAIIKRALSLRQHEKQTVSHLRKLLDTGYDTQLIHNERGVGYVMRVEK